MLESNGVKEWDINLGGTDQDFFYNAAETSDGGLIAVGSTNSPVSGNISDPSHGGPDMWVVKLSSIGTIQWQKRYGSDQVDVGSSVMELPGGGYAIGGHTNSNQGQDVSEPSYGSFDFWLVRLDASGNKLWDKRYGGSDIESVSKIMPAAANGFMLVGSTFSPVSGVKTQPNYVAGKSDMWWVLADASGNKIWDKVRGSLEDDVGIKALHTSDSNYLAASMDYANAGADKSENSYGVEDFWVIKFDPSLNTLWDHSVGGNSNEDEGGNLAQMADGGYLISGTSYSIPGFWKTQTNAGPENTWVVKVNAQGNKVWDKTILTGYAHDEAGFAIQLVDGCIIIANEGDAIIGGEKTDDSYNFDYWCIKFCDTTFAPLPVELISFTGKADDDKNILSWSTASEINNDYFTLLKSSSVNKFQPIKKINGAGNSTQTLYYSFTDENPFTGINYYQLQQTDYNGNNSFSKIISVNNAGKVNPLIVFPNPAKDKFSLKIFAEENSNGSVEIYNALGKKILLINSFFTKGTNEIQITEKLAAGIFLVKLSTDYTQQTHKLIIN